MKIVATFSNKDVELDRRLSEFQSNVDQALRTLELESVAEPQILYVNKTGTMVRVGQLVYIEGNVAIELVLAKPLPNDEGRTLVVCKRKSTANLTLVPIGSKLNDGGSATITAVGRYEIQVLKGEYWRAP